MAPLMLWVNLALVGIIYSQRSRFFTGVMIKVTGDSKLKDSPKLGWHMSVLGTLHDHRK